MVHTKMKQSERLDPEEDREQRAQCSCFVNCCYTFTVKVYSIAQGIEIRKHNPENVSAAENVPAVENASVSAAIGID